MKSLMEYLWKLYTEPDADEISRSTTGYTLLMTARASSVLKDYYKILIPLVLLARFTNFITTNTIGLFSYSIIVETISLRKLERYSKPCGMVWTLALFTRCLTVVFFYSECGIVSGLLLYLKEVVDAVQTVLGSKSWNLKVRLNCQSSFPSFLNYVVYL